MIKFEETPRQMEGRKDGWKDGQKERWTDPIS